MCRDDEDEQTEEGFLGILSEEKGEERDLQHKEGEARRRKVAAGLRRL